MNRKNILIGLILFLAVLNIATIVTVVEHINKPESNGITRETPETKGDSTDIYVNQGVRFLRDQLHLTANQEASFRKASKEYNYKARQISLEMSRLRDRLLEEMDREQPDTLQLNSLAEQIGANHVQLKKFTVSHYLGLKQLCTDVQKEELYEIFKRVLNPDGEVSVPKGQGPPGEGRRGRGQQGRGPWWRNQKDTVSK